MKYIITKETINKHSNFYKFLWFITFILFFPFAILAFLHEINENVLYFADGLRNKIVYGIFKIVCKKDCEIEENN